MYERVIYVCITERVIYVLMYFWTDGGRIQSCMHFVVFILYVCDFGTYEGRAGKGRKLIVKVECALACLCMYMYCL
jgi:hypothetical protein